jgi:hypothetical protein
MKKKRKALYKRSYIRLRRLASILNLSISKCFAFGNKVIGLDQANKALLISEGSNKQDSSLIELKKIRRISLRKDYGDIKAGELSKKAVGQFLKYIRLQFDYLNGKSPTIVSLYDREKDENKDLVKLDLSSKNLHLDLSKMIEAKRRQLIQAS